jgi:hypothetical protein
MEIRCQSSGENAELLTAPIAFVSSRDVAPACACPLSALRSGHESRLVIRLHHCRPLPWEVCSPLDI